MGVPQGSVLAPLWFSVLQPLFNKVEKIEKGNFNKYINNPEYQDGKWSKPI